VYLSLLPIGSAPASILGKRTKLPRSTARYICQQLVKKNLFFETQKGNTFIYVVESPEKLLFLIKKEEEELQRKKEKVAKTVEELKLMINPNTILPKVRFFEGKEEMISLYEEILKFKETIYSFEDKGEMLEFIPEYVPLFIKRRIKYKIKNKIICPSATPLKSNKAELRQIKTIDKKLFPFSCDIKICNNLVSIFSFQQHTAVGIAIEHQDIVSNFKILFNYVWNHLE